MKKIVITGGPCSGKSTLIKYFSKLNHNIINESAREVIQELGNSLDPESILTRQLEIFKRQKLNESKKFDSEYIFLDRSLIDILTYCNIYSVKLPKTLISTIKKTNYDYIFILDQLPFKKDSIRIEKDIKEAKKIHDSLIDTYGQFKFPITFVPVLSLESRSEFILSRLKGAKNGLY
jgi:predicted ATPase